MDNAGKNYFKEKYKKLGGKLEPVKLPLTIRINTLKTNSKKLIPRLEKLGVKLEKIPYTKHGYRILKSKFSMGAITEYLLGYYYIQEAAAQIPVTILDPKPDELVLDCCAAPGGKTTQIAAIMDNKGTVLAYELKEHRMPALLSHLERCGVENTTAIKGNFKKAEKIGKFDKILLDAPCAGNYLSEPGWTEKRTQEGIKRSSEIQKRLLKEAANLLKPNGTLVYSTCSLEPEENEMNIDWAIKNLGVKTVKFNLPIGDDGLTEVLGQKLNKGVANCKRFWPHKTNTEGFFIAKLVKK